MLLHLLLLTAPAPCESTSITQPAQCLAAAREHPHRLHSLQSCSHACLWTPCRCCLQSRSKVLNSYPRSAAGHVAYMWHVEQHVTCSGCRIGINWGLQALQSDSQLGREIGSHWQGARPQCLSSASMPAPVKRSPGSRGPHLTTGLVCTSDLTYSIRAVMLPLENAWWAGGMLSSGRGTQ